MIAFERRDIESLKHALKSRRDELLKEVQEVTGRDEDEPFRTLAGEVSDSADEAVADTLLDADHAAVGRDLGEMRAIDRTLERIDAGDYGRCIDCAEQIAHERLQVNPTADRCITCQDRFEKTHGHESWPQL